MRLPELVTPDSPSSSDIATLERRWRGEFGGTSFAWDEAWLWPPLDGYAIFECHPRLPWVAGDSEYWMLHRIWFRKELRGKGLLSAVWPVWLERYGEFKVTAPNESMQAFLAQARRLGV